MEQKHALTKYRERKHLTLDAFAALIGASKGMVWKWEKGKAVPRPLYVRKIIDATGGEVSPADWYVTTPSEAAA